MITLLQHGNDCIFVDKCVFSQGALAEICIGSVKNLVRYGAMHQLGNFAIRDVHIVAYLTGQEFPLIMIIYI